MENKENFENKEITIVDLVQIAGRWIGVLLIGAIICAAIALFYSTNVVTPMYSANSKFVIQTKGQDASSDVLESQRTVAYAQLAVGTYIDIINTRNFAEEVSFYMNGGIKEKSYTSDAVDTLVKYGILADGGIVEGGKLKQIIKELSAAGVIDAESATMPVSDVVKKLFITNGNDYAGLTSDEIDARLEEALAYENLFPRIMSDDELLAGNVYYGDSEERVERLKMLGLGEGNSYKGNTYDSGKIRPMISFSTAEESTTFSISVKSSDYEEAYTVARLCEIIIADYIEALYPGTGVVTVIESAVPNSKPINNNTTLLVILGFIAGFVAAYVIVYIIELLDDRIKNQEELAAKTGLSVVGIIPDSQYEKSGKGYYTYSSYDPSRKSKKK